MWTKSGNFQMWLKKRKTNSLRSLKLYKGCQTRHKHGTKMWVIIRTWYLNGYFLGKRVLSLFTSSLNFRWEHGQARVYFIYKTLYSFTVKKQVVVNSLNQRKSLSLFDHFWEIIDIRYLLITSYPGFSFSYAIFNATFFFIICRITAATKFLYAT